MPAHATPMSSLAVTPADANKAIVRDYIENVLNGGDIDRIDLLFGASLAPKVRQIATMLRSAYPDMKETVHTLICEGDTVAARWTFRGTHEGMFLNVAGTNRKVEFDGLSMYYIRDGRIDDDIAVLDLLTALRQLGAEVVPPNSTKSAANV